MSLMSPCTSCPHRTFGVGAVHSDTDAILDTLKAVISGQQSEIEGYADWMKKFQQVYTRLPVGIQGILLQELQKENMVKIDSNQEPK